MFLYFSTMEHSIDSFEDHASSRKNIALLEELGLHVRKTRMEFTKANLINITLKGQNILITEIIDALEQKKNTVMPLPPKD